MTAQADTSRRDDLIAAVALVPSVRAAYARTARDAPDRG